MVLKCLLETRMPNNFHFKIHARGLYLIKWKKEALKMGVSVWTTENLSCPKAMNKRLRERVDMELEAN